MSPRIIDQFEVVQVDEKDGTGVIGALTARYFLL